MKRHHDKPFIPVIQGLKTFCRRCGNEFVPFRRGHRLCTGCHSNRRDTR